MNFPFQFCVGSHISMLIRESEVGLRTKTTLQCAGIFAGGAAGAPPPPRAPPPRPPAPPPPRAPPPLGGGGPSGTTAALVIVAFVSAMVVRLSHGAGAAAAPRSKRAMLPIMMDLLKRNSEGGSYHIG